MPRIIGHRGAKGLAPENTLGGIRRAALLGVKMVEVDVSLLMDGIPVIHHDATIERCSDGRGAIREMMFHVARRYDFGSGEKIPHLAEMLDCVLDQGLALNLELKTHADEGAELVEVVVDYLGRQWPADHPLLVSSFDHKALKLFKQARPDVDVAVLFVDLPRKWKSIAREMQAAAVHVAHDKVSPDQMAAIKAEGYQLNSYTVNDPRKAQKLFEAGVDGLFTDRPDLFSQWLP